MTDWKRIDGYDNYEVSKYGEVRNINTGNYLNGCVNNCGYHKVGLTNGGKLKIFQLHRHHDGDNLNNEALNLYWQSYDEFREWGDQRDRERKKQH